MHSRLDIEHDEELRRVVEQRDAMIREELKELEAEAQRIGRRVAELQLLRNSFAPILTMMRATPSERSGSTSSVGQLAIAVPGNRSTDMPPRREPYRSMSLFRAVALVLNSAPQLHADRIAELIYEVQSRDDVVHIKRGLVSTLSRGARRGLWERVPDVGNTFRAKSSGVSVEDQPGLDLDRSMPA
jgi:hypothetical protein